MATYYYIRAGSTATRTAAAGLGADEPYVELVARHHTESEKSPYERLLGDAIRGDPSLFTQDDSVEAAWRVVDPALKAGRPVLEYEPGTWGPLASNSIVDGDDAWHDPQPEKTLPC